MSKTPFSKKRCHFCFLQFPLKPLFLLCFLLYTVLVQKKFWPKQIVATKMRVFCFPSWHKQCQAIFAKNPFFWFSQFWMTTFKNPIFIGFFGLFHFLFFSFFCFYFSNKKRKNQKCNFLFENIIFDNPKFCKNTILTHCDTICASKNAKKHYKTAGKNSKKKLGPVFNL